MYASDSKRTYGWPLLVTLIMVSALIILFAEKMQHYLAILQEQVGPTGWALVLLCAYLVVLTLENLRFFTQIKTVRCKARRTQSGKLIITVPEDENVELALFSAHLDTARSTAIIATALGLLGTFYGIGSAFVDGAPDPSALNEIITSTKIGVSIWLGFTVIAVILDRAKLLKVANAVQSTRQRLEK